MYVLNTWEEVKALPVGSIIYDADDDLMRRYEEGWALANTFALLEEDEATHYVGLTVSTPVRVLWTPEDEG